MSEPEGSAPVAEENTAVGEQADAAPALPPEEKRGGGIRAESLPDTLEHIASGKPRTLGSDASIRLLLGWAAELYKRLEAADQFKQSVLESFNKLHGELADEKVNRAVSEQKLQTHERFQPLRVVSLMAGVSLFSLGIDHLEQATIGYPLLAIGAILVLVSAFSGRSRS